MFYMISIIIPIYNAEAYLRQCIDSIIRQTYTDWELILVDDGSSDSSASICDEYEQADKRIIALHQPNKGVSAARNAGIVRAKGKYLCFVDADDWLEENFLANFHSDEINADLFISGWIFNTYGKAYSCVKYQTRYCQSVNEIRDEFLRQNLKRNGYPWGKLFRASIIQSNKLCFNEKMSINEDHLFVLHSFFLAQSVYITESVAYHYRVFSDSGAKLSEKGHSYDEYMENYKCFAEEIVKISGKWKLDVSTLKDLQSFFVFSKRLRALESLVLNNEKMCLGDEIDFWKNNNLTDSSYLLRIIYFILCANLPVAIKWMLLKLIYKLKVIYHSGRNRKKSIMKQLNATSDVIIE